MRAISIIIFALLAAGAVAGYVFVSSHTKPKIEFIPMENMDPKLVEKIARYTAQVMRVSYKISKPMTIPRSTYNAETKQCDAVALLNYLPASKGPRGLHRLAILEYDLGYKDTNFYFSYHDGLYRRAIMSLARLRPEAWPGCSPNEEVLINRAVNEAAHNLAHTYGMDHCNTIGCIMGPSRSLEEIDVKRGYFCDYCQKRLKEATDEQQAAQQQGLTAP